MLVNFVSLALRVGATDFLYTGQDYLYPAQDTGSHLPQVLETKSRHDRGLWVMEVMEVTDISIMAMGDLSQHLDSSTGVSLRIGPGNNGAIDQGVLRRARYAADIRARYVRILPSSPDMMVLDWEISQRSPTSSGSDLTNYVNGSRSRYVIVPRWFLTEGMSSLNNLFRFFSDKVTSSAQADHLRAVPWELEYITGNIDKGNSLAQKNHRIHCHHFAIVTILHFCRLNGYSSGLAASTVKTPRRVRGAFERAHSAGVLGVLGCGNDQGASLYRGVKNVVFTRNYIICI